MTTVDDYVGEDMSSKEAANNNDHFEAEPRKPYDVPEDAQKLYKSILKDVFKPKWHRDTHRRHNKAHRKAMETLQDKVDEFEKGKDFLDEVSGREALAHALITYRKEAGLPVSDKAEDFHRVYEEVDMYLRSLKEQKGDKVDVEDLIKSGNIEDLLMGIHRNELARTINSKVKYQLHKKIATDKDPKHYQNLFKAYANEVGAELDDTEIAKIGRDDVIKELMQHYNNKMAKTMDKYTTHKAKAYHAKHPEAAKRAA